MVKKIQTKERRIIATKVCALQRRHNELYGYFVKSNENSLVDYHTLMDSYEAALDLLVQLLSLEGLSPAEIVAKIQDVTGRTNSLALLKREIVRSLDVFDIGRLLRSQDNGIDHTLPSSGDTQNRAKAGALR